VSSLRLAAVLVFALATPAFSQTAPEKPAPDKPAATPTGDKKPPPQEKMICRRETVPGSNIPERVCRTQSQIEAARDSAQRAFDSERGVSKHGEPGDGPR
jgi:hypothetical protein